MKKTDFWAKNTVFFGPKAMLLGRIPIFFVTITTGHYIGKVFVLKSSHGGPFVALVVAVVSARLEAFFDFSFPSYGQWGSNVP